MVMVVSVRSSCHAMPTTTDISHAMPTTTDKSDAMPTSTEFHALPYITESPALLMVKHAYQCDLRTLSPWTFNFILPDHHHELVHHARPLRLYLLHSYVHQKLHVYAGLVYFFSSFQGYKPMIWLLCSLQNGKHVTPSFILYRFYF